MSALPRLQRVLLAHRFPPLSPQTPVSYRLPGSSLVRSLSTSHRRAFADPLPGVQAKASHSHSHPSTSGFSGATNASVRKDQEEDIYVNPYKGGPSALDKAAELFFFTEILRGEIGLALDPAS